MQGLRFLDFPREIRDMIYFHALVPAPCWVCPYYFAAEYRTCHIDLYPGGKVGLIKRNGAEPYVQSPGLLRVSRQVHQEAAAVLYGSNTFEIPLAARRFITSIGSLNAALLRDVSVSYETIGRRYGKGERFQRRLRRQKKLRQLMATSLTGLQRLEIAVDHASRHQGIKGRKIVDVARGLTEIDRDVARSLPNLRRTVLLIHGSREQLCHPDCHPMLTRVKDLGWSIRRKHWSLNQPEVDDDFDLEKTLVELESEADDTETYDTEKDDTEADDTDVDDIDVDSIDWDDLEAGLTVD